MEDPESDEWEIQEYASLKECDEPSTVKWILDKGCWIGKKMVITGVVITSAPIVVPPLVVFSAMGVAFSVPFGLVFASYACTNKLMSTLLPIPPPPLTLEYYGDDYDQEKEDAAACRFELDDVAGEYRQLDVNERGYFTNEYEDYEIVREQVIPEEQEQVGDGYVQEVEALVPNIDEKGYYTDEEENVLDDERTEDLIQGVDMVFELDNNMRQGEALLVDVDENSCNNSEYDGNELGKENVMQDEEERISDGYGKEVEASVSNVHVDEDVEEGYYTDEEEIETEGTSDELGPEKVDNEHMEDIDQEVDIVLELDDGGNDTRELREAVVVNVDENFDEKSCYTNENDDERELEDHVSRMENAIKEEEREQMEDIEQRVEMRLGLDVAADECKQREVETNTNISGSVDEIMYEDGSEQMEDVKQGVEMRLALDVAPDECKQVEEETITDIGARFDDKRYEEECEQMDDVKQGAEMRLGLDVAPDECKPMEEETITNIGGSVDDKRYEEESEQMEDIKQGVEMRLGLDVAPDECKQTEEGTITSIDVSVDDKGYEEDVGESLEGDVGSLEEEQKGNGLLIESHLDENISNAPVATLYDKEKEASGVARVDYSIDEDGNSIYETASNVILEEVTNDETADPVIVKEMDSQKLFEDESKNEEPVGEMRHIVVLASGNEDNNFNAREVEEIDLVAREVRGDANKHERDVKSDEEVIRESMGTQEKHISDVSNGVNEDAIMETKKEHLTNLNADAREVGDESGLDLFDASNTNVYFEILEAGDEAQKDTFNDDVDFMALPAFRRALDADNAKSASKVYTEMSSREDMLDDEKIWEKIGAMRAIVGYKAPSQPTCIGELKALYVFTGVEPPASYKDDSDLDEVSAKLKFLMSIVGVK